MQFRYLAVLLLLGAIWGASFLFIKVGVAEIPPATLVAVRLILGAALLVAALYGSGLRLPREGRTWRDLFFVGVVGVVLPFLLITWGEQTISSGMTAIINATTPLFTLMISYAWTREERLTGARLLGVILGFVGVVVAVGMTELSLSSASTLGQLAVLGAALCYGITGVYGRRAFRGLPALVPAAGQILTGAIVTAPIALALDGLPRAWPSAGAIGAVLLLAVLGTGLAYIMFYWLLGRIGATRTSMVTYLTPPVALVYGALLLSETITANTLLGLALVLSGMALANGLLGRRPAPAAVPGRTV